jgi:hypothetical protein
MVARNATLVLGGMAEQELDLLRRITPLSEGEAALVTSWAASPTWVGGALHPGRGKYLIKSGERIGLPVSLRLTPGEQALYDTDGAFAPGRWAAGSGPVDGAAGYGSIGEVLGAASAVGAASGLVPNGAGGPSDPGSAIPTGRPAHAHSAR